MQARMAMMKVRFPGFTHWWPEAHDQMLKFPQGAHDDFRGHAGALRPRPVHLQRGRHAPPKEDKKPKMLTYGWVIEDAARERKREKAGLTTGGW